MMRLEKIANVLIIGCVAALALAIGYRLTHMGPFIAQPVVGLWKLSIALSLMAIAIGVNRKK